MTTLRVACFLSALACASVQAQTCSGGSAGGTDATGNQCSAPDSYVDSALPTAALDRHVAANTKQAQAKATPTDRRSVATAAPRQQVAAVAQAR